MAEEQKTHSQSGTQASEQSRAQSSARTIRPVVLNRNFRAESAGLVSALIILPFAVCAMLAYQRFANGQWLDPLMRFIVGAAIVGIGGLISFLCGYAHSTSHFFRRATHHQHSQWDDGHENLFERISDFFDRFSGAPGRLVRTIFAVIRRGIETLALSFVYGYTIFLAFFVIIYALYHMIGFDPANVYMLALVAGGGAIFSYFGYVSGEMLTAKTLSSFLPIFVISGIGTAGITSTDPGWWRNNFSELGDRTTPAATLFNVTIIATGICMLIISYFAVFELVASHDQYHSWSKHISSLPTDSPERKALVAEIRDDHSLHISHFHVRMMILLILLTISCVWIIGVGTFRYSAHPLLHNFFGRTMVLPVAIIIGALPWLAPQMSRSMYAMGYMMMGGCVVTGLFWLGGATTLTNVEGLFLLLYLLWFIVFTRQAAAIEMDRTTVQIAYDNFGSSSQQIMSRLQGAGDGTTASIVQMKARL